MSKDYGKINKKKQGTSILFFNEKKQVLLFLRDDKAEIPFPNCWDVLGGHVESGETPRECIIREMKEEIGLELKNPELFNVYDLDDRIEYTYWQRGNFQIQDILLNEGQRLKWFTEEEIRNMSDNDLAFNFKRIIIDFYQQQPFEKS